MARDFALAIAASFTSHPKTQRFSRLMREPNAFGYLIELWSWAIEAAPKGDLSALDPADIEWATGFRGPEGRCFRALCDAGFIDHVDYKPTALHNWMKPGHTGYALVQQQTARERWRRNKGISPMSPRIPRGNGDDSARTFAPVRCSVLGSEESPPAGAPDPSATEQATAPATGAGHAALETVSDITAEDGRPPNLDPTDWRGLQNLWGSVRIAVFGTGIDWVASAGLGAGHQEALDQIREHPVQVQFVRRSMEKFWRSVKSGEHDAAEKVLKKPAFAFACWLQQLGPDTEEFLGVAPKIAPKPAGPQRCGWHAKGGKGASRNPLDSCPECREQRARNGGRSAEPTAISTVIPSYEVKEPATAAQLAELRAERLGARASPAPDESEPTVPKSAAGGIS